MRIGFLSVSSLWRSCGTVWNAWRQVVVEAGLEQWLRDELPLRFEGRILPVDVDVAEAWGTTLSRSGASDWRDGRLSGSNRRNRSPDAGDPERFGFSTAENGSQSLDVDHEWRFSQQCLSNTHPGFSCRETSLKLPVISPRTSSLNALMSRNVPKRLVSVWATRPGVLRLYLCRMSSGALVRSSGNTCSCHLRGTDAGI
jgi:hypothetical protein